MAVKKVVQPLNCLGEVHNCERTDCIRWYVGAYNELWFPNDGARGNWMMCDSCIQEFLKIQKENKAKAKSMGTTIRKRVF